MRCEHVMRAPPNRLRAPSLKNTVVDNAHRSTFTSWVPMFVLIWFSPSSFIYEMPYGGAEKSPAGRSVVRLSTLAQALAFGKRLEVNAGNGFTYSVFKMEDGDMWLKGTYPKAINAQDARIKFRKRKPKLGGADEALLGVGGMGDDIWRELMERDNWGSIDDAWAAFRKELELGREIEVVDENGERIQYGDYPDEGDPEYD
mmetsp:Transcript_4918/g.9573  ORF Transcript_4918/g.9573 Transcript_4918/m.9573 type:complete len:201 (-) Transcript_4918:150-752(-)